ncbi:MAG: hypothetical protein KAT34_22390 [Candidatus Aminicenantes bacterium]|nr:hypothetical protein [Candidatus Aminicenantes bacterium]
MKKTIKMVNPAEGDQQEIEYWKTKTPKEKLDILQYLREEYYIFKNESRKGFQRVYRIIEQE